MDTPLKEQIKQTVEFMMKRQEPPLRPPAVEERVRAAYVEAREKYDEGADVEIEMYLILTK